VLTALDATPETTCLIGDSPFDVQTGLNAGFPCFCVTPGSHSSKQLLAAGATADAIFPDLPTLGKTVFDI
jgi:phosphoglycolate phosphatase